MWILKQRENQVAQHSLKRGTKDRHRHSPLSNGTSEEQVVSKLPRKPNSFSTRHFMSRALSVLSHDGRTACSKWTAKICSNTTQNDIRQLYLLFTLSLNEINHLQLWHSWLIICLTGNYQKFKMHEFKWNCSLNLIPGNRATTSMGRWEQLRKGKEAYLATEGTAVIKTLSSQGQEIPVAPVAIFSMKKHVYKV